MESKLPTQTELKHAALDRRALANYSVIHDKLVDLYGKPILGVRALNYDADFRPRLNEFKWISEGGAWANLGDGTQGVGVIAMVKWLGACSEAAAVEYLSRILDDLNSAPVAAIPGRAF
jgi:hypothetical protein